MALGLDIPRSDGLGKLSGRTLYVDDLSVAGLLHGGTVRSHVARGRIRRIHFDPAIPWREYTIVDHRDIAGRNEVLFIDKDEPALAASEVRHKHEPIVLLAHRSPDALRRGLRGVRVEIDPLPAVFDIEAPLTPELIQYGADNVFKHVDIRKGDPGPVFARAAHVIEGEYRTGSQEHVYLETQGMIAHREDGRLVLRGTLQCPYYVLTSLMHLFDRPADAFRVIQTPTGGGFGGKEDYPSIIAIHAALLAEKAAAPVKIVYDRGEDMAATTKRHPSLVRHRTGLDRDGRLLAMEIDVLLDGGAYVTLSPVVLSRGCIHAAGPYNCEHIAIRGEARMTNTPPNGAFRGFGAPQTLFALERHMDVIADRLGLDPAELRRRNLIRDGQTTATGQVIRDGVDRVALQERALALAGYQTKEREHADFNASHPYLRRGNGLATFLHGAGFTGSGETRLASEVWVEGRPDGRVEVLTANTDMGQGTETVLRQVAAERLGVPMEQVDFAIPDTSRVPNSGPTVASRTAMVVGKLVERACDDLAARLQAPADAREGETREGETREGEAREGEAGEGEAPAEPPGRDASPVESPSSTAAQQELRPPSSLRPPVGCDGASLAAVLRTWHAANPGQRLIGRAKYQKPPHVEWDDATYRGDAYACFAWATYAAEVEIDLRTCNVRVLDFIALQEVGKVLHPTLARGQIAGGVVQAIGWALMEDVVTADGAMKNNQLTNYIIPTSGDLPPIRVFFEESAGAAAFGPAGAKGIGELPMDGPAPAIVNAVCRALGVSACEIPLTPERLLALLSP